MTYLLDLLPKRFGFNTLISFVHSKVRNSIINLAYLRYDKAGNKTAALN